MDSQSCRHLAEQVGDQYPHAVQRLLADAVWDVDAVRDDLSTYVADEPGVRREPGPAPGPGGVRGWRAVWRRPGGRSIKGAISSNGMANMLPQDRHKA